MEAPRGVEPTGTNGRTRHTFSDPLVGSGLVLWWFLSLDGKEHCFLVVTMTIPVKRFCSRPLSGSRTATTGIGRVAGSVAGRSRLGVGRSEWFCGGHGPGETPGPFPNPEAKAWHGDGTALERVWESSAPPHSTSGFPSSVTLREPLFFVCCAGPPAEARCPGVPVGPFPLLGVRIIPRAGRSRTPRDFRNFRGSLLRLSDG